MEDVQPLIDALRDRGVSGEAVVIPQVSHNLKAVTGPSRSRFRRASLPGRRRFPAEVAGAGAGCLIVPAGRPIIAPRHGGNEMSVTVRPVTDAVGAEIIGVDLRNFSDAEFAAIERAWYAHSMILLRGQQLTDDHLLTFSRRFGELDPPPNQERGRISPPGYPDIYVVSNVLDSKGDPIALWAMARRSGTPT